MRKGKTNNLKPHVVIFVEGDTDEVFLVGSLTITGKSLKLHYIVARYRI